MPQTIERNFPNDCNRKGVDELTDILAHQRRADDDAAVLIDDHFRMTLITIREDFRPGNVAHVVLHGANAQAGLARFCLSEPGRRGFRIGEEYLRYCSMVGGGRESCPRLRVFGKLPSCASGNGVPAYPRLILAHVSEQDTVIHIARRIKPATGNPFDAAGIVDIQPIRPALAIRFRVQYF